jgi:hypothetical protein
MSKDPLSFVNNIINENTIKKAGSIISNIVSGIIAGIAIIFLIGAASLVVAGLTTGIPFFYFPAVFLGLIGILAGIGAYKVKSGLFIKDMSKDHYKDYKACEDILKRVKSQLSNEDIDKNEYSHICDTMKKELKEARIIINKIDNINATLKSPDCDTSKIIKKINEEKSNSPSDEKLINTLENHIENINKLKAHEKKLREEISNLRFNFNSVYTKLTLIGTQSKTKFTDIETDIQKILDFKLEVNKYEEELLKDM